MKLRSEISEIDTEEIVTFLNKLLANEYALYTKTRNVYWNVNGPKFIELHKFFKNQYEALDIIIDNIAERVRSLGHFALGSLLDFLSVTHLDKENHDFSNPKQIIQTLVNDHETIIHFIRSNTTPVPGKYMDPGTADFVSGLMAKHERMVRKFESYLS